LRKLTEGFAGKEGADIVIEKVRYRCALFVQQQQAVVAGIKLSEYRVNQLMPRPFFDLQAFIVDQENGVWGRKRQVLTICRLYSGEYFAVEAQGLRGEGGGEEKRYNQ